MYWITAAIVVILDQLSKYLVRTKMVLGSSAPFLGKLAEFTYIQNSGAAFSILEGKTSLLLVFTAALMIGVSVYANAPKFGATKLERFACALLLGGGLGNFICRVRVGSVTDFINIHILPVFNLADIAVCIGCGLIIISALFLDKKD